MVVWLILLLVFIGVMSTEYYYFATGVPTVTSFSGARRQIVACCRAAALPRPRIVDLGSGTGRLASELARALPQAEVSGVELSPVPCLYAMLRQKLGGPRNLRFRRGDFWTHDIAGADIVILFLTDNVAARMSQKLQAELKPGALVISNETALTGDWRPVEVVDAAAYRSKLFIYRQAA